MGKRRVNFQRCWLPVSRIGLHRRGVERVNCGPKLLDLGERGVYSSYTYLYSNRFDQAKLQLSRELRPLPTMKINPDVKDIFSFKFEDFELVRSDPHPHIKAAVAI